MKERERKTERGGDCFDNYEIAGLLSKNWRNISLIE